MLDFDMKEQLKGVFSKLTSPVVLKVFSSDHVNQSEGVEMLEGIASTSPSILLERLPEERPSPEFTISGSVRSEAIRFRGVPGGHEFTSLILAILYVDGKGRHPDEGIIHRIRNLKGPIRLTTYMSLSCENCPEVVQALNLMATLHDDFHHETVDGAMAPDEVARLGIQGVPSVIHAGKLVHSGKIQLLDLLSRLEEVFGKSSEASPERDLGLFDVVVIGGGPAGASAAIYSVRKGLKTAIVAERFGGQLQETKGIENMISMSYTEGVRLSAQLGEHLSQYPVQMFEHRRVQEIQDGAEAGTKRLRLESGETITARAVIVATGAKWRQLGVPGEKEHIGQGVAYCAHCDGPFYKGKRVAVVGGGNSGVEAAIDLSAIATEVTLFEYNDQLKADGVLVEKLKGISNARIVTKAKTTRVMGEGKVTGIEYQDRDSGEAHTLGVDGVFVQIGLLPNTQFLKGVVELSPYGEVVVDERGRTSVPGIYAAGDVTTVPFKQIVIAMGEGAKVALAAFEDRLHAV